MTCNSFQLLKLICSCTLSLWKTFLLLFIYSFNKKKEDGFSCSLYLRFQVILSHYYPFDCRNTFIPKNNDDDHWKGEANWEEEEIVAKVIWSCPWWATASIRWRWIHLNPKFKYQETVIFKLLTRLHHIHLSVICSRSVTYFIPLSWKWNFLTITF